VVEYDRANPQSPFVPQGGPTYTIHRPHLDTSRAANFSLQDIINILIDNRIPLSWVDHSYAFGVIALNNMYMGSTLVRSIIDPHDNERLARLRTYGVPPAITEWNGWHHPTPEEVHTLHAIEVCESTRPSCRGPRDASAPTRDLTTTAWLLVGRTGVVEYLTHRPQDAASQYAASHPIPLPSYTELDGAASSAVARAPPSGNPLGRPATVDVVMAANVDVVPPPGPQQGLDMALAPLSLGTNDPGRAEDTAQSPPSPDT
jgi:hypothetical protein